MFRSPRVRFDPRLLERARICSERAGYSSVEEFIVHTVERAVAAIEEAPDEQELKRRLKGLGYLGD
jgi:hypothetical protein